MNKLPPGWTHTTIGNVVTPFRSIDPTRQPDHEFTYIDIGAIDNVTRTITAPKRFLGKDAPSRARRVVQSGDILFSTVRTYLKNVALVSDDLDGALASTGIAVLRSGPTISNRYLFYWISSEPFIESISKSQDGTMYPAIRDSDLTEASILLPPLVEQHRIVAELDALFARSKDARSELAHLPNLVMRYRQAILTNGLGGQLSTGWKTSRKPQKSEREIFSQGRKLALLDLCEPRRGITYGVIKLGDEFSDGTPCLRTSNVKWLRVDTDGMKRISPALSSEYARTILKGGEVLVNVRGTLGGVAVATSEMAGWNVSREVAVVPVDTARFHSEYVAYWIGANASQRWLNRMEKGVAYTGINLEDLRKLPVEVPSLEEQTEVVRRINEAFLAINMLTDEVSRANRLLYHLDRAVLSKAFRGELVASTTSIASEAMVAAE